MNEKKKKRGNKKAHKIEISEEERKEKRECIVYSGRDEGNG